MSPSHTTNPHLLVHPIQIPRILQPTAIRAIVAPHTVRAISTRVTIHTSITIGAAVALLAVLAAGT